MDVMNCKIDKHFDLCSNFIAEAIDKLNGK